MQVTDAAKGQSRCEHLCALGCLLGSRGQVPVSCLWQDRELGMEGQGRGGKENTELTKSHRGVNKKTKLQGACQ